MAKTADYGFGEYQFARGWFMISDAAEVKDVPVPVRFFGEDMVLYRGQSGQIHLVEAYCPHMGAHLGLNTTSYIVRDGEQIQGESIRCPFHGWRFGPDGKCDDIPYSSFIPKAACLKTYTVEEKAGIIWMWHDPEGLEPDYPLPDFGGHWDEPGWVRWKIDHMGDLNSHGCELVDNMADLGHMVPIHGAKDCVYFANEFKDHIVHQYFDAGHRTLVSADNALLSLDTWYTGPAILQSEMKGEHPSFIMIAHTPIEDGKLRVWHALMVKVSDGSHPFTEEEKATAFAYQEADRLALAQDVEIWDNKRACVNPLALPADGPYGKLRIWYKQFYNPRERAADVHKRVNGLVVTLDGRPGGKDDKASKAA
jgi:3-ketosteroid 9alpha-monooxygenase subunit A